MKRSAGAPASIWRASALLPAYTADTRWPVAASNSRAKASITSRRLAAAKTEMVSALAGEATKRAAQAARARRRAFISVIYRRIQRPALARAVGEERAEFLEGIVERALDARFQSAEAREHLAAEGRDLRAAAAAAPGRGGHDRLAKAA